MPNKRRRYLFADVPVPRRTAYRRRKEAALLRMQQANSDSEISDQGEGFPAPYLREKCRSESIVSSNNASESSESMSVLDESENQTESDTERINVESLPEQSTGPVECAIQDADNSGQDSESDRISSLIEEEDSEHSENITEQPQQPLPDDIHQDQDGQNRDEVLLSEQLCQCTTTTEGDALLMCLALGMRHNLTWACMVDISKLINSLFGRPVMHASKYYFMKYLGKGLNSTTIHMYCSHCEADLGTKIYVEEEQITECNNCNEPIEKFSLSSSYFISVNLEKEFRKVMEVPKLAQDIMTYRFNRKKNDEDAYEDIFDGDAYKQYLGRDQILADPRNFSVTMNTDGLALGKSSLQSAWPIFMYINEASPKNRKKNIIFAGIWVGKKQPNMRIFLKPFVDELKQLSLHGFTWKDKNGSQQSSKVLPLVAILDSGARYKFLNMISYHGYYGCTFCYQKAEHTPKGRRFTIPVEAAQLRTQESMLRDMQVAHQNRNHRNAKNRIYKGCKGFTPLVILHPILNLAIGVITELMHNGCLGVTRSHAILVLTKAGTPFYVGDPDSMNIINQRLQQIRPPTSITRTPRELKDYKLWKASEWRSWLLFYGFVCFEGVLDRKYLEQFGMLSAAFFILLQRSVSSADLIVAHRYLLQYVFLTQELFGKTAMVFNIHLLQHVTAVVKNWGPLWAQNAFVFESENRNIAQMHTSPGRIALQLTRKYLIYSAFPKLCEMYASTETPLNFTEDITGKRLHSYMKCGEAVLIGNGEQLLFTVEEEACLANSQIFPTSRSALSYRKILYNGARFSTKDFSVGKKNDDSWIRTLNGVRGSIDKIYLLQFGDRKVVTLLFRRVEVERSPLLKTARLSLNHIKKIRRVGEMDAVRLLDVTSQCIYMDLDTGQYIVDMPYGCYGD